MRQIPSVRIEREFYFAYTGTYVSLLMTSSNVRYHINDEGMEQGDCVSGAQRLYLPWRQEWGERALGNQENQEETGAHKAVARHGCEPRGTVSNTTPRGEK